MPELAKETAALLQYLLPGFLAAWVYYALTSHAKPIQFERIIQALIFTLIIQILIVPLEFILTFAGRGLAFRPWDAFAAQFSSVLLALSLGITLAYATNRDVLHGWLRKISFTTKTSHPSEWFGVFSENVTYVILHLNDERRLYGWPKEWPTESGQGHFYIMQPSWLIDKENSSPTSEESAIPENRNITGVEGLLINVKDVKWVEFVTYDKEKK